MKNRIWKQMKKAGIVTVLAGAMLGGTIEPELTLGADFLPGQAPLIHMFFLQKLTFPQTKASLPGKWCMINIFFDKIKWISASKRCVNRSRRMQDQDFFNVSHF